MRAVDQSRKLGRFSGLCAPIDDVSYVWRTLLAREKCHVCILAVQLNATLILVPVDTLWVAALLAVGAADALLRAALHGASWRCCRRLHKTLFSQ